MPSALYRIFHVVGKAVWTVGFYIQAYEWGMARVVEKSSQPHPALIATPNRKPDTS